MNDKSNHNYLADNPNLDSARNGIDLPIDSDLRSDIANEFISSVQELTINLVRQVQGLASIRGQEANALSRSIHKTLLLCNNIEDLEKELIGITAEIFYEGGYMGYNAKFFPKSDLKSFHHFATFIDPSLADKCVSKFDYLEEKLAEIYERGAMIYTHDDCIESLKPLINVGTFEQFIIRQICAVPLSVGGRKFGVLFLLFQDFDIVQERIAYKSEHLGLQVSIALKQISEYAYISRISSEKSALLSLAREISLVQSAKDLSTVFAKKHRALAQIRNCKIFSYDKELSSWKCLVAAEGTQYYSEDEIKIRSADILMFCKEMLSKVVESHEATLWKISSPESFTRSDVSELQISDLASEICYPLLLKNDIVGSIVFELASVEALSKGNNFFISELTSHLAIAVFNITKAEAKFNRGQEKAKLRVFGERIGMAKDREHLSELITPYLLKVFGIEEFIITLKNSDQITYSYFLHGLTSEEPVDLGPNFRQYSEVPEKGSLIEQTMLSEEPLVFELDQLIRSGALWRYVGATQVMASRLKLGNRDVGILWTQPNKMSAFLLNGICSKIAIAVDNIYVNEEAANKEREREGLMALNTALAMVRNTDDLQRVVNNRLKQFLNCGHGVIGKINEQGGWADVYVVDDESSKNPEYANLLTSEHPLDDGIMDVAAVSSAPIFFEIGAMVKKGNAPDYLKINYANGLNGLVISRLLSGQKLFGFWMVFFEEDNVGRDKIDVIESLSNQICIAITHININEEIERREMDKSQLLEFSTAIASVSEPRLFAEVLHCHLYDLYSIDDYIIFALYNDELFYAPLLYDKNETYYDGNDEKREIYDGIMNITLASEGLMIHDVNSIVYSGKAPGYITMAQNRGIAKLLGVTLRVGDQKVAVLYFNYADAVKNRIGENMFASICSLLAVAVENMLSKEKVLRQLDEIDNYKQQLEEEQVYLKEELQSNQNYGEIIGESMQMRETFRMITQVAPSDSTVLILGETGTGKELIARALHNNSPRHNKLMVKVNCAALPVNLIESELFGHERGSFTGATDRRIGKFELANNGTLFLDEIGEMPLEMQVKLLRAIQEKEIERIGGRGVIKVNVRIIAATNRDLEKEMDEGRFRSDLYYRLNIFPIHLCPLRERKEDIPLLARHFIGRYSKKTGKKIEIVSNKLLQELTRYTWPGNIRELEHLIERSVLLTNGGIFNHVDLPREKSGQVGQHINTEYVIKTIDENERDHILQILKYCGGRIAGAGGAASLLGVPPSTLNSKLKKLGIKKGYLPAGNDSL